PGLVVGAGDVLFAHVYLDPANPPKEIMLQWFVNGNGWEHRAYWGENLIDWGADGTAQRRPMGPLPRAGEWVRLEVPAGQVGRKGGPVGPGWAFPQFGGTVYWDKAGLVTRTLQGGQTFDSLADWLARQQTAGGAGLPRPVQDALKVAPDRRNRAQT